jgi:hypothetical protein
MRLALERRVHQLGCGVLQGPTFVVDGDRDRHPFLR